VSAFKQMLGDTLAVYPDSPGYKTAGTSQEAARRMAPLVTGLRAKVLRSLREGGPGIPRTKSPNGSAFPFFPCARDFLS